MISETDLPLVKKIQTDDGYYLYDARSNRLLRVSAEIYDLVEIFHDKTREELIGAQEPEKRSEYEYALSILVELSTLHNLFRKGPLEQRSEFVSNDEIAGLLAYGAKQMTLEITDSCNLRCSYCVYSGGYKGERTHGKRRMTSDVAHAAIDFYIASRGNDDELAICFWGGEPLLHFEMIQECYEYANQRIREKDPDRSIFYSMTTNGVLLNGEKLSWLMDKDFHLIISLDGPAQIHNHHRVFTNGKETFEVVFKNLQGIYEKDADFYNGHISFNCVVCPCSDLSDLEAFFNDKAHLFGNRLKISTVAKGFPSYFAQHLPYQGRTDDFEMIQNQFVTTHVLGRTDSDEFKNSFSRMLFEHDYLLFIKRIVLDEAPNRLALLNTCYPGQRKVFVDLDGTLHLCEKIDRSFPIGDIWNGYNIERIRKLFNDFAQTMDSETCRSCWGVRLCPKCFAVGKGGTFSKEFQKEDCPVHLASMEKMIRNYCSILEKNSSAFDYMENITIM